LGEGQGVRAVCGVFSAATIGRGIIIVDLHLETPRDFCLGAFFRIVRVWYEAHGNGRRKMKIKRVLE
jgi:hypothetical protein